MTRTRFLFPSLLLVWVAGCDCAGPTNGGPGARCEDASDCQPHLACTDGVCAERADGAVPDGPFRPDGGSCVDEPARQCRGGRLCCAEGEECVDDFTCDAVCENARCGENNLECCGAGEICLDGVVCAADCAAGLALCGASLDVCCDAGQVCVDDACATPGDTCTDDFDCLAEGTYCEPTIGRCLEIPDLDPVCEVRPDFDAIALEVEWHWDGVTVEGTRYDNVVAAPMVGDVSGDGIADVVVPVYPESGSLSNAILVALHGRTGALLWSLGPTLGPVAVSAVALGNLDPADDALEIVYRIEDGGVRVIDGDGLTELARATTGSYASATPRAQPALADMDHDGDVEIVAGCQVWSFEPMGGGFTMRQLFDSGACIAPAQTTASTAIANLDADPELEITTGGAMFQIDGSQTWPAAGVTPEHGIPAVADLDLDGAPEVISIRGGGITIRDGATGAMRVGVGGSWLAGAVAIPGGGIGGAPTVADFDADGMPEVSVAGQGCYVVYDPDCLPDATRPAGRTGDCTRPAPDPATTCDDGASPFVRWTRPTQDLSSSVTGSSVFDFQGDGVNEVVYNDECFLHVYDGRDGSEVLAAPHANSSRTALEYPLVVDVDRDGNSEIVVPANDDAIARDGCAVGTHGIYVLGDPGDRWVRTRPIWNQFAYHVTNVDDRGAIPMTEADNWSTDGLNNYRTNVQGAGVFNAPNLTVVLEAVPLCGEGSIRLSAVVTNAGSRGVPAGVPVEFVETAPMMRSLEVQMTTRPLLPGQSERITITVPEVPFDTSLEYEVRVDGTTATMPVLECNEDDNAASAMDECPGFG